MKYSVHKINTAGNTALTSNNIDEVNHALAIIKDIPAQLSTQHSRWYCTALWESR